VGVEDLSEFVGVAEGAVELAEDVVDDPELIDDTEAVGSDEDEGADADAEPGAAADEEDDDKDADATDDDTENEVADGGDAEELVVGVEGFAADTGEALAFVGLAAVAFDGEDVAEAVGELAGLFVFGFCGGGVVGINEAEGDDCDDHVEGDERGEDDDKDRDGAGKNDEGEEEGEEHGEGVEDSDVNHAFEGGAELVSLADEGATEAVVVEAHGLVGEAVERLTVEIVEGFEFHFPETPDADALDDETTEKCRDDDGDTEWEELGDNFGIGDFATTETIDDLGH